MRSIQVLVTENTMAVGDFRQTFRVTTLDSRNYVVGYYKVRVLIDGKRLAVVRIVKVTVSSSHEILVCRKGITVEAV